jgi:hypothetical protein
MADDLRVLVEKIVAEVMNRLQQDAEFSQRLQKNKPAINDKPQWARTCTSYRSDTSASKTPVAAAPAKKRLFSERDILDLIKQGHKELLVDKNTILTPAAHDAAASKGLVIRIK